MDCEMKIILEERYALAHERISEIGENKVLEVSKEYGEYFRTLAKRVLEFCEIYDMSSKEWEDRNLEEIQKENKELYAELSSGAYEASYANPTYATGKFGNLMGQLLSALYAEIRTMIPFVYEKDLNNVVIRMELFLEVYSTFSCAYLEDKKIPKEEDIREILCLYSLDYSTEGWQKRIYEQTNPEYDFFTKWILEDDLQDLRYLYRVGEYVTESEIKTAQYLNELDEKTIQLIADTYTEGYRKGFQVTGKDISKKSTVGIVYQLGFERVVRKAIQNFEEIGLKTTVRRSGASFIYSGSGVCGHSANKQYEYDHKFDVALLFDKMYVNRKLEAIKAGFEKNKEAAFSYGGPAVIEVFGEEPFAPIKKKETCQLNEEQQKLMVEYKNHLFQIQNEYIKEEERSFTIIAFPVPDIGDKFTEIFDEIIKINTLDYGLYQRMQQTIIDTLDEADYVHILGMNGNKTDLRVQLHPLKEKEKETKFENCVADVNIPVGEVFTSPVLKGTNGILHVTKVFLNGLEYKNLQLEFIDGMIHSYSCNNFTEDKENQEYIKENLLYHHVSLPMGEFAIGTNTTAYMVARKYGIGGKLPILIAEKMGPHFAVGDTCYSHAEEIPMYNPDGKEMIARENEISALRNTCSEKAYFHCHTDITIPYDELKELSAIKSDGSKTVIIENGCFVLEGVEELNSPFSM